MPVLFILSFVSWNIQKQKPPTYVFRFRVPIPPKKNETGEEFYWRSKKRLFPQTEIPDPIPQGLPNDDTFLIVSIEKDGRVKINSQDFGGTLENPMPAAEKLCQIFTEREKTGMFEPGGDKTVKAVVVRAPRSAKYGDFVKIIDTVKTSGAEPIALQIDELPK